MSNINRSVYIVDGSRSPFMKVKGPGEWSASDFAVETGKILLNRHNFSANAIDEVILGCAMPGPDEANIARIVALRLGCGLDVPAFTVMRNCASGMQALDDALKNIALGRSDLVLAGGTEAMSHAPLLFNDTMAKWFSQWFTAKTFKQRLVLIKNLRPSYFVPVVALLRGLSDPLINLNMGQTAENLAYRFNITREEMDEFAYRSHMKSLEAYKLGAMEEVTPLMDLKGKVYEKDDGIRADVSLEKLATLKPYFDKKYGMVTAGNSSQITDGAALFLLASAKAVKEHKLPVIARIVDVEWSALDPAQMGLGPVNASAAILKRHKLQPNDFDAWEINEAFAAQVLACLKAFNDEDYCKNDLGLDKVLTAPDISKVNPDGGAIAVGHPIGASGARIVLHLIKHLEKTKGKRGMAAICIGGGQGGAMYIERVTGVEHD